MNNKYLALALMTAALPAAAENVADNDSVGTQLQELVITHKQDNKRKLRSVATNTECLFAGELKRAACCNLGESFTTNPSVDVNYNDAATGAKQIKLLGLSGAYVQMLTENIPNFRGAAAPYGLGYIAGPWMSSIQVSKGASSVKNGYESLTGQINIEMLKPQSDQYFIGNGYANHQGRAELNAAGNVHINDNLSTALLIHGENDFVAHDENKDGYIDMPQVRQVTAMNRWAYKSPSYIFQAGVRYLNEKRHSGQDSKHNITENTVSNNDLYAVNIYTNRWEAFAKNAFILDKESGANIALMLSGSLHNQNSAYGRKLYDVDQSNIYASLMFERDWHDVHSLSAGLSFNYDRFNQQYRLTHSATAADHSKEIENVSGAYAQYTLNLDNSRFVLMTGLRYDYSSLYGSMVTPRMHLRFNPSDAISLHASVGRGYRAPHPLAEFSYLLASSRAIVIDGDIKQESGWNMGGGLSSNFNLAGKKFTISGEYYYTTFNNQTVADLYTDAHSVFIRSVKGDSYSHAAQFELSCDLLSNLNVLMAYRYTDVREDYGYGSMRKPLTSRSKGLFSVNYTPFMGLWAFDATLTVNGSGLMPTPDAVRPLWDTRYPTYLQLSAQVTRSFRHFDVYVGGENLTGYKQKTPIIDAMNAWGSNFDATMVWGPLNGAVVYAGFRVKY
jgi:outer membrane receptor for ferrienterochelin and colicin